MEKLEKPPCTSCGTELTVNQLITEFFKCTDEHGNFNIPYILDAALGPNSDAIK